MGRWCEQEVAVLNMFVSSATPLCDWCDGVLGSSEIWNSQSPGACLLRSGDVASRSEIDPAGEPNRGSSGICALAWECA